MARKSDFPALDGPLNVGRPNAEKELPQTEYGVPTENRKDPMGILPKGGSKSIGPVGKD